MATMTLTIIRSLVRSDLNESSTAILSNTELNAIANDGYKDVAAKGLGYENKIAFTNIPASVRLVPLAGNNVVRVNYVEYDLGASGCLGMLKILPQALGHISIGDANTPQYWFQWGDFVVVEPLPDVATYDINVYASCYPAAVMTNDNDTPSSLPAEFHEDVYFFTLAYAALKLKRWADAATAYNRYIDSVQRKRFEYILKYADSYSIHQLPNSVTVAPLNKEAEQ